jgi:GMP reductase
LVAPEIDMQDRYLSYDDVSLVAKYSELDSRADADVSTFFLGDKFRLPVVPANMEDVIDRALARTLSCYGYFYIMHRFKVDICEFVRQMQGVLVSISLGVNTDSLKILEDIYKSHLRVDYITIDVAHGHHSKVKSMISHIRKRFKECKIIAGNVMTPEAVDFLALAGADAVKVGIGGGSICSTRYKTGFYMPMFTCVVECADEFYMDKLTGTITNRGKMVPIIADGGIKHFGDISKAIAAGASMVMSGKLFASCLDSPAKTIGYMKQYRGSTSYEAKNHKNNIEGIAISLDIGSSYLQRLEEIEQALRSSVSYAGGTKIADLKKVEIINV